MNAWHQYGKLVIILRYISEHVKNKTLRLARTTFHGCKWHTVHEREKNEWECWITVQALEWQWGIQHCLQKPMGKQNQYKMVHIHKNKWHLSSDVKMVNRFYERIATFWKNAMAQERILLGESNGKSTLS